MLNGYSGGGGRGGGGVACLAHDLHERPRVKIEISPQHKYLLL